MKSSRTINWFKTWKAYLLIICYWNLICYGVSPIFRKPSNRHQSCWNRWCNFRRINYHNFKWFLKVQRKRTVHLCLLYIAFLEPRKCLHYEHIEPATFFVHSVKYWLYLVAKFRDIFITLLNIYDWKIDTETVFARRSIVYVWHDFNTSLKSLNKPIRSQCTLSGGSFLKTSENLTVFWCYQR